MSNEKTLELLKEALNIELWAITLYEDYLNRISDKRIREGIIILINESVEHAAEMRKAIHKMKLKMPVKKKLDQKKLKLLLDTGIKEEKDMQKIYTKIIKNVSDKEIKATAKKIFNNELRHEKIIKELIKSIK